MKKLLIVLGLLLPMAASAYDATRLDRAPIDPTNQASLQRGAKVFVNYCLSCHAAAYMRYNRLRDIGLTDGQIKANLLFAGEKVGDTMTVAMRADEAREWFGAPPPDLSVVARARGADWLYTYLRGFYRDDARTSGWNNTVFDNVAMPHVLWQLQGEQRLRKVDAVDAQGNRVESEVLVLDKQGSLSPVEYDRLAADLVNYLAYMAEPAKSTRLQLGVIVLLFLSLFFVLALALKKEYWKDVH